METKNKSFKFFNFTISLFAFAIIIFFANVSFVMPEFHLNLKFENNIYITNPFTAAMAAIPETNRQLKSYENAFTTEQNSFLNKLLFARLFKYNGLSALFVMFSALMLAFLIALSIKEIIRSWIIKTDGKK